ncbi:uncharacterized protein PFL1_01022 [Pseudozyma flocculosa PF-1]|uniref:rRNA-processing protein EFG1 n=1 Tax=Pseudozyma flocculosa TaxID=84751 RepID=A0A5C3F9N8_9BASI|nr:uncharacterized protein PFL1_01022 [Pseudozyma flocculosa PF-1]EPQ31689.1 hypothetical protein PFL1_01022 [Pseudozyma flocculosa PF-1]SPO40806.1 uncharacterized protein PSFLO_06288 [Pseudozyma flocculosa]
MAVNEHRKGKKPQRGDDAKSGAKGKGPAHGKRKHPSGNGPARPNKKAYTRPESLEGIPGAGKLKSSIRQTKRLLAKENLAPGTKIEAERRLAALTADLEKLQSSREEKNVSARYHKVKFFERQKLVRKIKQTKKAIEQLEKKASKASDASDSDSDASGSDSDDDGKPSIEDLEVVLTELRCLLHYVLRYPPDLAYVSLFANGAKEPQVPSADETDATRAKAFIVLDKIRKAVAKSELSNQPEIDLESGEAADRKDKIRASDRPSASTPGRQPGKKAAKSEGSDDPDDEEDAAEHGVEGDDFFARDSDDDDE